jgi:hypothetical protein
MLVRMQTEMALVLTRVLAELVRMRPRGGRCGGADANGEDEKTLLFFSFYFFRETVYTDEGNRPVHQSTVHLAASELTEAEQTPMVEH